MLKIVSYCFPNYNTYSPESRVASARHKEVIVLLV